MNLLLSRLDERQRRWYAAVESSVLGHGRDRAVARITGRQVTAYPTEVLRGLDLERHAACPAGNDWISPRRRELRN